jgi:hypothetical protein
VSRHVIPWLVSIPIVLGGTEVARWLSFRLAHPNGHQRAQALQAAGHGYLAWPPMLAGAGIAVVLPALVARVLGAPGRDASGAPIGLARFAVLPPLAFALQEHLESVFHNGMLLGVVSEPRFLPVLALQLPLVLLAYLVARASSVLLSALAAAPRSGGFRGRGPPTAHPVMCACT